MTHNFFATLSRMKYIERWALMRNARTETLSEHTLDVAMIAHALCVIGNVRYGRSLDADRAALRTFAASMRRSLKEPAQRKTNICEGL